MQHVLLCFTLDRYGYAQKLLGHALLENRKIQFILTNKLLFLRYFEYVSNKLQCSFPQNENVEFTL